MSRRPNRILAQPATVAACQQDRAEHTPAREADAITQRAVALASGAEKGRAWRGRRR